jgi:hypothetical protein
MKKNRRKPRGSGKPDPRKGSKQRNQSKYSGNNEKCPVCGLTYGNLKTGFTYYDVWLMLWTPSETPTDEWKYKTRGVILGKWHEIKNDYWKRHLEECKLQSEYEKRFDEEIDPNDFIDLNDSDMSDCPF